MLTPQIQKKQFLIWSLISTSARPIPRNVAGTTGLMNVAQLRQTTITIAMCAGTTPKFPAISRDSWGLTPMFLLPMVNLLSIKRNGKRQLRFLL